jgi:hypothetical protein
MPAWLVPSVRFCSISFCSGPLAIDAWLCLSWGRSAFKNTTSTYFQLDRNLKRNGVLRPVDRESFLRDVDGQV